MRVKPYSLVITLGYVVTMLALVISIRALQHRMTHAEKAVRSICESWSLQARVNVEPGVIPKACQ